MTDRVNDCCRTDARSRILYLDGLRGFAALMVVLYHYWIAAKKPTFIFLFGTTPLDLFAPIEYFGGARVSLFFVLSGFLLYLPFARDADRRVGLGRWLRERFRRVAPPYYAALLLALLPVFAPYYVQEVWRSLTHQMPRPIQIGDALTDFPECIFFAHGLVPGKQNPLINGPLWTMTPEVELYLTFPLLVFLARQKWMGGLFGTVAIAVTLSIAYRLYLYATIGHLLQGGGGGDEIPFLTDAYQCLANSFLGRWAEFALGMAAAELIAKRRVPSRYVLVPLCCGLLVLFCLLRNGAARTTPFNSLTDAVGGMTFATMLLCCAAIPTVAHLFSARPLTWIGTFAYSLYLVHCPVMGCVQRFLQSVLYIDTGVGGKSMLVMYLLVVFPTALGVARLVWWGFERPFLSRTRQKTLAERPRIIDIDRIMER